MEASLDARHGTSDEFYDPYCDSCYEDGGQNVRAFGFCKVCVQFLCKSCHSVHGRLQSSRNHLVVHGEDMPKSQDDKPPRFDSCDAHPKLLKDQFCGDHKILLCSACSSSEHNTCSIKHVEVVCTVVDTSDTGVLYDRIRSLQEKMKSALPAVDKAVLALKDQEKIMLNDAQNVYDQIIAQANKLHGSIKNEIKTSCQSQISRLTEQRKKISDMILKLDSPLTVLGEYKAKPIDIKVFLSLQENVTYARKIANELQELRKSLNFVSLSFVPSQTFQEILQSSFTLGKIRKSEPNTPGATITVPEIMFPISTLKQTTGQPNAGQTLGPRALGGAVAKPQVAKQNQPLKDMKAIKKGTVNIKLRDDMFPCCISGMAITKDKRILMVDNKNYKVKMFSPDMKFLSSVSVPDRPWDIAVISEREAAVTARNKSLVILGISGSQLSIKTTTQLSYDVDGISRYNDKLVVTSSGSNPPSVKLIDQTGRVYWSVSSGQQGQPLFSWPWYVSSHGDGRSSTVIVIDRGNDTLTLLNGDTGEVITRRQLKDWKVPRGVTTDTAGNVYVCYGGTSDVSVLSGDLSEEKILLSGQNGLSERPQAIVYDIKTDLLTISYVSLFSGGYDKVDQFKLS